MARIEKLKKLEGNPVTLMVYHNCLSVAMKMNKGNFVNVGIDEHIPAIKSEINEMAEDIRGMGRDVLNTWGGIKRICKMSPKKVSLYELFACRYYVNKVAMDGYDPKTGGFDIGFSTGKTVLTFYHNLVKHYLEKYRTQGAQKGPAQAKKNAVMFQCLKYCIQTMTLILWLGGPRFNELFRTFIPTIKECILLDLPEDERKDVVLSGWQALYNIVAQYTKRPDDFYVLVVSQDKFYRLDKILASLRLLFQQNLDFDSRKFGRLYMCQVVIGALVLEQIMPTLERKKKHKLVQKLLGYIQPVLGGAIQRLYKMYVARGLLCGFRVARPSETEKGQIIFNGAFFSVTVALDHTIQCAYSLARNFGCEDHATFDSIILGMQKHGLGLMVNLIGYLWESEQCEFYAKRYRKLGIIKKMLKLFQASSTLHATRGQANVLPALNFVVAFNQLYYFLERSEKVNLAEKVVRLVEAIASREFTNTDNFHVSVLTLLKLILFADHADLFKMYHERVLKKCNEIVIWGFKNKHAKAMLEQFMGDVHHVKSGGKFQLPLRTRKTPHKKLSSSLSECKYCHKSTEELMRCSRCRLVYYCSRECQTKDWKQHKKICKK